MRASAVDSSPPKLTATVVNSSDQPIYHAEVYWRLGGRLYGEPNPDPLGIIMPGQSASISRKFPPDKNVTTASTELTFRDAGDILWRRRPDGDLTDLVAPVRAGSPSIAYRKEGV